MKILHFRFIYYCIVTSNIIKRTTQASVICSDRPVFARWAAVIFKGNSHCRWEVASKTRASSWSSFWAFVARKISWCHLQGPRADSRKELRHWDQSCWNSESEIWICWWMSMENKEMWSWTMRFREMRILFILFLAFFESPISISRPRSSGY